MEKNAEQAAKIRQFQKNLANFDWSSRECIGKDWVALMKQCLDAGGFDFDNLEHIERFQNEILDPQWRDLGNQEKELREKMIDILREAGATEAQINWGMIDHVPLTKKQKKELDKLTRKVDEVRSEMLPVMGLAVALSEERKRLTA